MKWESPYQTFEFHCALKACGFAVVEVATTSGKLYLSNWYADELTGWELGFALREPSATRAVMYVFEKFHLEIPADLSGCSYYTIVVDLTGNYQKHFSKNCQRNLKKAINYNLSLELVSWNHHYLNNLIIHILKRNKPPGMDFDRFKSLIFQCVDSDICDIFMVNDQFENIIAGGIVLKSGSVANLRFTYYLPQYQNLRPMNYLISKVADFYNNTGYKYLDLSGFYAGEYNQKMININRFKREFGNKLVEFKVVRNRI
jgi:hypothetical protein